MRVSVIALNKIGEFGGTPKKDNTEPSPEGYKFLGRCRD